VDLNLFHSCQHGSVPGHTTTDVITLTQPLTDLCRFSKQFLARFDNVTSACYDRIIVSLAMTAARCCRMPCNAVSTHAEALQFMQYTLKTVHGISEQSYQGTPFGTGQGSGASPAAWLSLVVLLMLTLDQFVPERMESSRRRCFIWFHGLRRLTIMRGDMIDCPSTIAQHWEKLLFYSGGSLNL
jgi:hypothetical protein